MKTKDVVEMVNNGVKPVVKFTDEILNILDGDPQMMGRIIGFGETENWGGGDSSIEMYIDLSEFESHNRSVAQPSWNDGSGGFTKTWFESGYYPEDGKVMVHTVLTSKGELGDLSYCEVVEMNELFQDYLGEKGEHKSYVDYLEKRVYMAERRRKRL